jgi:hypothetical protein
MLTTDWDKMTADLVPNVEALKERFKTQFPNDALPTGAFSTKGKMRPYWAWMSVQPEYGKAISDYQRWLANNYEWETSTSEGENSHYVPIDKHARRGGFNSQGAITYAAQGGFIDGPMIAYGINPPHRRMILGESGPEVVLPLSGRGVMGPHQNPSRFLESIQEARGPHQNPSRFLEADTKDREQEELWRMQKMHRDALASPGYWDFLKESVSSGRYGNANYGGGTGQGTGEGVIGIPLNITLNIDGKILSSVLVDISRSGTKIVHERGIIKA